MMSCTQMQLANRENFSPSATRSDLYLLPVLERMRIKSDDDAPWSKNTHVDVCGMKLIHHRAWELMQTCLRIS